MENNLEKVATQLIETLTKKIELFQNDALKYQGAVEGIKLLLQEYSKAGQEETNQAADALESSREK